MIKKITILSLTLLISSITYATEQSPTEIKDNQETEENNTTPSLFNLAIIGLAQHAQPKLTSTRRQFLNMLYELVWQKYGVICTEPNQLNNHNEFTSLYPLQKIQHKNEHYFYDQADYPLNALPCHIKKELAPHLARTHFFKLFKKICAMTSSPKTRIFGKFNLYSNHQVVGLSCKEQETIIKAYDSWQGAFFLDTFDHSKISCTVTPLENFSLTYTTTQNCASHELYSKVESLYPSIKKLCGDNTNSRIVFREIDPSSTYFALTICTPKHCDDSSCRVSQHHTHDEYETFVGKIAKDNITKPYIIHSHQAPIQGCTFLPGTQQVMIHYEDGSVRLWNFNKKMFWDFGCMQKILISPCGQYMLAAKKNKTIFFTIQKVEKDTDIFTFHGLNAKHFSFDPCSKYFCIATDRYFVRLPLSAYFEQLSLEELEDILSY
ncbi:MAG: hypothetical protein H6679_00870 [Epsilonproteobacteria bacterium]|nr:hypothetical protein [Campylobacterota bacterium]